MRLLILIFIALLFTACGGGGGSSSSGPSNTVTVGGIEFDVTSSDSAPAAWIGDIEYVYTGYGDWATYTLYIYLDDGFTVNGVPCLRQTVTLYDNTPSLVSTLFYYYAEAKNGHIYTLRQDSTNYTTPQIYLHDDLSMGSSWTETDPLTSDVHGYEVTGVLETTPNGGQSSAVTVEQLTVAVSGSIDVYYSSDLIPLEIGYINYDGVTGHFLLTAINPVLAPPVIAQ